MGARLVAVSFVVADPERAAAFWSALLGRPVVRGDGLLLPGGATQAGLRFAAGPAGSGPHGTHLHLTSASTADQRRTVERALGLGARHLDVGQRPEEGHVVLADPEGTALCVIEPGNTYLAGCGLLGEVACDGSRDAGVFWSAALGWPLVWDDDGETAVQSPLGGTKVAWSGTVPAPAPGERFDLATDGDLAAEVARLVALGATVVAGTDPVVLADPDGGAFSLRRAG